MFLTRWERLLKNAALALGCLQGVTYAILAVICIILYNIDDIYYNATDDTYMGYIKMLLYYTFLSRIDNYWFTDYNLKPAVFTAFAWIYLVLNSVWVGLAIDVLRKQGLPLGRHLKYWSYFTILVCVWDFITVAVLGADYQKCLEVAGDYVDSQTFCANSFLVALVIAAKGFVLWFLNLAFAAVMFNLSKEIINKNYNQSFVQAQYQQPQPYQQQQQQMQYQQQERWQQPKDNYPTQIPSTQQYMYQSQPQGSSLLGLQHPSNINRNQHDYPYIPDPDYHGSRSPYLQNR